MKFSTKEDIDVPVDAAFDMVTNFQRFEDLAQERGAKVVRHSDSQAAQIGMSWSVEFTLRGRLRKLDLTLSKLDRPNTLAVDAQSPSMNGTFGVDLEALSETQTRMRVHLDVKPQKLSSRLLVQSLRLAKASLLKRFKLRVAEFAKNIEARHNTLA